MRKRPKILITAGDPEGIGPEVIKKALRDPRIKSIADFFVIKPNDKTGFGAIKKAGEILKRGEADALVTAPVNKARISGSGIPFRGHTEYLAKTARVKKIAMMFCSGIFRVTIVTRHIALKDVSRILTKDKIVDTAILTNDALIKYFRIKRPEIALCGLNPHAGEGGLIGNEEERVIIPAIKKLKSRIPRIQGPLPADIVFHKAYKGKFDAVIAMYHDQGLGPFKMMAFEKGVNVTLGLPFVRTSPDHGTAYDIAGKGIADPTSMKEAIRLASFMCGMRC